MHRTPTLLDVCSGDGGAGMGYSRAGFDVFGIDVDEHPAYPFPMMQTDGVEYIRRFGHLYDLIHVSTPCQAKCTLTVGTNQSAGWGGQHTDLLPQFRRALATAGRPHIIEQPIGQSDMRSDMVLCGEMFGLSVIRHRKFELNGIDVKPIAHKPHRGKVRGWRHGVYSDGPYVAAYGNGGGKASVPEMQDAMGIDWTEDRTGLTEAIPPAYTQYIGQNMKIA